MQQNQDGALSEEIVTMLIHDPWYWLHPPLSLSHYLMDVFQGQSRMLANEKCYMLQITRLVSHLIRCNPHRISFLIEFLLLYFIAEVNEFTY